MPTGAARLTGSFLADRKKGAPAADGGRRPSRPAGLGGDCQAASIEARPIKANRPGIGPSGPLTQGVMTTTTDGPSGLGKRGDPR